MTIKRSLAAAAAALLVPMAATATTFDFTGYSDGVQENLTQSAGGFSMTANAGAYSFDGSVLFDTDVDGFGTDLRVSTQDATPGDAGIGVSLAFAPNLVPNINGAAIIGDLLTFTFDQVVDFGVVQFGNVGPTDSFDVFLDGNNLVLNEVTIQGNNPFALGLRGTSISFGADALDDSFNIQSLTVSSVPLPAGSVLLLSGLGLAAAWRRKRA